MPRVAQGATRRQGPAARITSPTKIPLNDDQREKAVRFQSRQALHDLHLNQIKAAASPIRRVPSSDTTGASSPRTPQTRSGQSDEGDERGTFLALAPGGAMTPLKRVPLLANFEEWMKMATDNKINATNSWNFALIDYFHDMSLLREGDGVNFQKASCTLDGCVKIYTSRVDSVATETGKLLSGLANSDSRKQEKRSAHGFEAAEDVDDENDNEGEDGVKARAKRKRSSEATLAQSFVSLQLKKFELEFSVDPLFKKASADFDEGGAKGLLLNHLSIDVHGRIVFDSSDDSDNLIANEAFASNSPLSGDMSDLLRHSEGAKLASSVEEQVDMNVGALQAKFFPRLELLDEQDVCPSLRNFDLGDPTSQFEIPFLKDVSASSNPGADEDGDVEASVEGALINAQDVGDGSFCFVDPNFGDGGDAWARAAALNAHGSETERQTFAENETQGEGTEDEMDIQSPKQEYYQVKFGWSTTSDMNVLEYFDNNLQRNWAGPEHWKIRRIKDLERPLAVTTRRREKEIFEIDFLSPLESSIAEAIYTPTSPISSLSMPKAQHTSRNRNLLPDDRHFNSRQLVELFLKPRARLGHHRASQRQRPGLKPGSSQGEQIDEAFWAQQDHRSTGEIASPQADYDANFFQDDPIVPQGVLDEDDFADAQETFLPGPGLHNTGDARDEEVELFNVGEKPSAFVSQLVTQGSRSRPDYVQYARVAKKVDVRRLKEEMWKGIGSSYDTRAELNNSKPDEEPQAPEKSLKFTGVMKDLQSVYPRQDMADISTSYCFICLLHLANEKSLSLSNECGLQELRIYKDRYLLDATMN